MNQNINASGSFSWGPNEGAVTSVDVYWLYGSDNPPDWPGANPGVLVSQAAGILYNMNIGSGTGNGDYTLFQVLNGITTDSRIPAAKLLSCTLPELTAVMRRA